MKIVAVVAVTAVAMLPAQAAAQQDQPTHGEMARLMFKLEREQKMLAKSLAANRRLKRQIKQLRQSRNQWRDRALDYKVDLGHERDANRALARGVGDKQLALDAANGKITQLTADVASAAVARDQALAGLPAAISVVPLDRFVELVLNPAKALWPCDSTYVSGAYWSVEFYTRTYC